MQFDQQYPTANHGFKSPSGFFKGDTARECCGCGERTKWIHMGVLLYFCSALCHAKFVNNPRCCDLGRRGPLRATFTPREATRR